MRRRTTSKHFTFFYPGDWSPEEHIPDNAPVVAVEASGEFTSITGEVCGGEQSSAVYENPQNLRHLALVLNEAADLMEARQRNRE